MDKLVDNADNCCDESFDSEDSYDHVDVGDNCSDQEDECQDFAATYESLDCIEGNIPADKLICPYARICNTISMLLIMKLTTLVP